MSEWEKIKNELGPTYIVVDYSIIMYSLKLIAFCYAIHQNPAIIEKNIP